MAKAKSAQEKLIDKLLAEVKEELIKATSKFGPMASAHEGYAVIKEELDELWEEVKSKGIYRVENMHDEAKQIAAMAVRFMMDVIK